MIKISYKNIKNVRVLWQLLWTCLNFIDDKCYLVEVHIRRKQMSEQFSSGTYIPKQNETNEGSKIKFFKIEHTDNKEAENKIGREE